MTLTLNMKRMTLAAMATVLMTATAALAQNNAPTPNKPAEKPANAAPATPVPANTTPAPAADPNAKPGNAAPAPKPEEKLVYVLMKTTKGDITLELNGEKAPISTTNFMNYVDRKFYDGLIFHRVISGFMIQGGGFNKDQVQKAGDEPIKNEWQNGLKNKRGTIAMARIGGNINSATSQFFINVVDNDMLDQAQADGAAYAVFGKVVAGMKVVDAIRNVPVQRGRMSEAVPTEMIVMESVTRITADEAKKMMAAEKNAGS